MLLLYISLSALLLGTCATVTDEEFAELKQEINGLNQLIKKVRDTQVSVVTALARQVSQQQLHLEEVTRSFGDSGLKVIRLVRSGTKPYFSTSFTGTEVAAIHEHSNYRGTVGMGELVAVLNGVEFRTRHNDYKMRMPSRNSTEYGATEDIPYPEVPPQVLAQPTVELQIKEMREWFKAWKNGDHSKRDYRKYFRPNLCYLEGSWTNANEGEIDEPFLSERHAIDAKSFFDLQTKIRYTSVTGKKSTNENYAYLPSTISDIDEHGNIAYAQWNYRILCHPIKNYDVPLKRIHLVNDLGARVANGKTVEDFANSRAARFALHPDPRTDLVNTKDYFVPFYRGSYMDLLMGEIPGKDNYPAKIVDNAFGDIAYAINAKIPFIRNASTMPEPLNAGYYHSAYKVLGNDAMGKTIRRRGYSDNNLYVAFNTQPKVTAVKVKGKCKPDIACRNRKRAAERDCVKLKKLNKPCLNITCSGPVCQEWADRVSYAIPLELIYTTPLQTWNPYKLKFFDKNIGPEAKNSKGERRNGSFTNETAYLGVSNKHYALTPIAFFNSDEFKKSPADTTKRYGVGVLDPEGVVRQLVPSGIKIKTRNIPGVGQMRIRYPVMPIHEAGTTVYKEVQALADMALKKNKYLRLYPDAKLNNGTIEEMFTFEMSATSTSPPGPHSHTFELSLEDIADLKAGKHVTTTSSQESAHDHELVLEWKYKGVYIKSCDGGGKCWDGHKLRTECPDCRFL